MQEQFREMISICLFPEMERPRENSKKGVELSTDMRPLSLQTSFPK